MNVYYICSRIVFKYKTDVNTEKCYVSVHPECAGVCDNKCACQLLSFLALKCQNSVTNWRFVSTLLLCCRCFALLMWKSLLCCVTGHAWMMMNLMRYMRWDLVQVHASTSWLSCIFCSRGLFASCFPHKHMSGFRSSTDGQRWCACLRGEMSFGLWRRQISIFELIHCCSTWLLGSISETTWSVARCCPTTNDCLGAPHGSQSFSCLDRCRVQELGDASCCPPSGGR